MPMNIGESSAMGEAADRVAAREVSNAETRGGDDDVQAELPNEKLEDNDGGRSDAED